MSSIIASSDPPLLSSSPATARGELSSSVKPIDWASRRAGSIVSTQTLRPCSAARSAKAAAVVVLPTPPAPQHTTMDAEPSSTSTSTVVTRPPPRPPPRDGPGYAGSRHSLFGELAGEFVQAGEVDRLGEKRKLVGRPLELAQHRAFALLEQHPAGVLGVLGGECVCIPCRVVDAGRLQTAGDLRRVDAAVGGRCKCVHGQQRVPHHVD